MITINGKTFVPSKFAWSLQDVSQADSGRDASGTMWKNTVTTKRKIELEFSGVSWSECSQILHAFSDNEYFDVLYPDMLDGVMETRTFYVGDRSVPVYVWFENKKICTVLSFNIIER